VIDEIARAVVVAFVVVEFPTMTRFPLKVEEAEMRRPIEVVGLRDEPTTENALKRFA
jgi:hypothetical protein